MRTLFQELHAELQRVRPKAAATLRPGLSSGAVQAALATLPYRITPDAAALYEWADGADGPLQLLPGAYFVPLQRAMDDFRAIHAISDRLEAIFPQPYRECFRFLSDWSDGGYAFGRIDSASAGRIVKLCIHDEWQIGFDDLTHLLTTSIACYREGVFPADEDELPDFAAFYRLAGRLNPGVKVWRSDEG